MKERPLFSDKRLAAMSQSDFTTLVIKTRLRGLRYEKGQYSPAPEYAAVLRQIARHQRARLEERGGKRFVYVLAGPDHVKIGLARDPAKRIAVLQTAHPERLELLFVLPGGREVERKLHARFARYREQGEWFRRDGHLRRFIDRQLAKARGGT